MRHARLGSAPFVLALTLLPAPTLAQDWSQPWADPRDRPPRVDVSASAGFVMPTSWSNLVLIGSISPVSGVVEQVLTRDLHVEPDTELNAAVTYWLGRYGFRTHAGLSRSALMIGGSPLAGGQLSTSPGDTTVGVDTWVYDVAGAIGFREYTPTHWVWPYGFVGFGGITYNLTQTVGPPLTLIEGGAIRSDAGPDTVVVRDDGRLFLFAIDELRRETVFAVNVGVGTDFRIPVGPAGVGLRLEVSDHISQSPLGLRVRELSRFGAFAPDAGVRFGPVHHLSATAGLLLRFGR